MWFLAGEQRLAGEDESGEALLAGCLGLQRKGREY
jgi:hypothetical protein